MNIVTGSGRNRSVLTIPHASIVNSSPKAQQVAAKNLICDLLSIDRNSHAGTNNVAA